MTPPATPPPNKPRRLAAPLTALGVSVLVALMLAPVTFGPLFYAHGEPQIIANSGGLTGAAISFLVLPSLVWLLTRLSADSPVSAATDE